MNKYQIEGGEYEAKNELEAVKQSYKMAEKYSLAGYQRVFNKVDIWNYTVTFRNGNADVIVVRANK